MKIAFVTYSLKIGGVETVIFNLANSFKRLEHKVEVIETQGKGEWSEYFRDNDIKVRSFSFNLMTVPFFHVIRISRYLRSFDCILINDSPYAQAGVGLIEKSIKVFPVLHLSIPSMIQNATASIGQWNKIICISPQLKNLIDQKFNPRLSIYIPNGILPLEFVERDFLDGINILYVGRIEDSQKGILLLPKIASSSKLRSVNLKFIIVGDGPSMPELKQLINNNSLHDKVCVKGAISHESVINEMKQCHFLIMPSYYEGMPMVLLEAMSTGLIPIASYLPGHTDILVEEGITGFLGRPGDEDSFATAIIKAIENRAILKQISINASDLITRQYNLHEISDRYLRLFRDAPLTKNRNNEIDFSLLPNFPYFPMIIAKLIRKINRVLNSLC